MPNNQIFDKQIAELYPATLDILNSGKDLAFIVQIEGYLEDLKVAPDILISYIAGHILQQTPAQKSSFKGLVTDLNLNPVRPVAGDTWLAILPGLYQYFGGQTLSKSIGIFSYNGISWSLVQQDITGTGTGLNAQVKVLDFTGTDFKKDSPQDLEAYLDLTSYNIPAASLIGISAEVNGEPINTVYGRYTHLLRGFDTDTSVSIKVFYSILTPGTSTGGGGSTGSPQQIVAFGTDGNYYNILVDPNQGSNNLYAELNSTATAVAGNFSFDLTGKKYTIGVQVTQDGTLSVYADPA